MTTTAVKAPKKRIGDQLIDAGLITTDQLKIALMEQKSSGKALGEVFVSLGFVTEGIMRDMLGEQLGERSISLANAVPDQEALAKIPKDAAARFTVLPISFDQRNQLLRVAMRDIYDLVILDRLKAIVGSEIEISPQLAASSEIQAAIDNFYGYDLSVDGILHEIETGEIDYESVSLEEDQYSSPLVRLVEAILADAVKRGASDIHLEPEEGFLRIRYRIDGVLRQIRSLHKNYWSAITVRIKVIAHMNIAETRAPQDGHISREIRGHSIDFRVSTMPTAHGENIVLRVLDRTKGIVPLDQLGIQVDNLQTIELMLARPEGIILVTGPTGSGKTTTLYSMLNAINNDTINIMTLEDPIEYPMQLIRQAQVQEGGRLSFSNGIRALMRQDPDVILVGEIRDEDTAEMALRAAMTGHQVLSTLHTNSALGAIPRLIDIGVSPDLLTGNIIGIIAQRLVRLLCKECKQEKIADEIECMLLGADAAHPPTICEPKGCHFCDDSGYKGRMSLMEVVKMDRDLDDLIARKATLNELKSLARSKNILDLGDEGVRQILMGRTSLQEISRVVDLTDRLS